jgi:hypothetical protein
VTLRWARCCDTVFARAPLQTRLGVSFSASGSGSIAGGRGLGWRRRVIPGIELQSPDQSLGGDGMTGRRRAKRVSRRVSGSLTPLKQASSTSSRLRMASKPSSLSKSIRVSLPLTAAHVASNALSRISRSSGSNLCRSDLNKALPQQSATAFRFFEPSFRAAR